MDIIHPLCTEESRIMSTCDHGNSPSKAEYLPYVYLTVIHKRDFGNREPRGQPGRFEGEESVMMAYTHGDKALPDGRLGIPRWEMISGLA